MPEILQLVKDRICALVIFDALSGRKADEGKFLKVTRGLGVVAVLVLLCVCSNLACEPSSG